MGYEPMARATVNRGPTLGLLVCAMVLSLTTVLLGCRATKEQATDQSTPEAAVGSEALEPLTVLQAYRIPREEALEWRSDCYLEGASVVWSGPDPFTSPEDVRFGFFVDHRLGPIPWWESATMWVIPSCICVKEMETHFYVTEEPHRNVAFDLSGVALDSTDALLLAEALGGEEYRARFSNARVRMWIAHGLYGTPQLFWHIEHNRPPDKWAAELSFSVDAATGAARGHATLTAAQAMELLRKGKESKSR
jgi:hypothetical protein